MSGVISKVPPARLRASPIAATLTSKRSPARTAPGRSAVTITAATLRLDTAYGGTTRPNSRSMLDTDCSVATLRCESPVPESPTTMP